MSVSFISFRIKLSKHFKHKEPTSFKMIIGESPYPNQQILNNPISLFGRYTLTNEIAFFTQDSEPTDLLVKILSLILKSHDKAIRLLMNLEKFKLNHVDIASYLYYKHGLLFINRSAISNQNQNQLFNKVTDALILGSNNISILNTVFTAFPQIRYGTIVHPSTKASPHPTYFPFWVLHDYSQVQSNNNLDVTTFVI